MKRSQFVAFVLFAGLLGSAVGIGGACSDPVSGRGTDAGREGSTVDTSEIDALGKWCLDQESAAYGEWAKDLTGPKPAGLRHELDADLLLAARGLYAGTATMIPLSPSTCTRLVLTREAGVVTRAVLITAPFKPEFDKVKYTIRYRPLSVSEFLYTSDGFSVRGDYDADDFYEVRSTTKFEKTFVTEVFSPATNTVIERHSGAIVGPSAIHLVDEELVAATLTTTRDVTVSLFQKACGAKSDKPDPLDPKAPAYSDTHLRPCTKTIQVPLPAPQVGTKTVTEEQRITELIGKAQSQGSNCLKAAGMGAEADTMVTSLATNKLELECMDAFDDTNGNGKTEDEAFYAANDRHYSGLFPGKARIIVYGPTVGDSAKNPENFQLGTIGHELFHFFSRHDKDVVAAASTTEAELADQTTACEKLCFSSSPTMCHLAACRQKKISTVKKDGTRCPGDLDKVDAQFIESARGDGVSIAECTGGKQVGALCTEATQVMFCTTEADCKGACAGACKSLSISCDPACR